VKAFHAANLLRVFVGFGAHVVTHAPGCPAQQFSVR
jgi:hypothetical protein